MKSIPAVLLLGSTVAALTMLAKSDLILQLLMASLHFAAKVLPASVWIKITFVV